MQRCQRPVHVTGGVHGQVAAAASATWTNPVGPAAAGERSAGPRPGPGLAAAGGPAAAPAVPGEAQAAVPAAAAPP